VAEPEVGIDEVEIVVGALAAVGPEERRSGPLVVPGLEGGAGFQGLEDVHEARMRAALGQDLLDAVLLSEGADPPDELDGESVFLRQALRVRADGVTEGLGESGEVEDLYVAPVQLTGKRLWVADVRQRASDQNAVEA
jgi:hypothetical protein